MEKRDKDLELRRSFKVLLLENPNYFGNLSDLKLTDVAAPVVKKVSDTRYEELTCVGYNPESRDLGALVKVKLMSGYSGGPCTDGSKEYVRFYLDYGDGTWVDEGAVNFDAHDLPFKEDLCYAVRLRLDPKKRSCCDREPVLPKVRAILSWNVEPPPNEPNWAPVWGNRLECDVQIEPRRDFFCNLIDIIGQDVVKKIDPSVLEKISTAVSAAEPVQSLQVAQVAELKKVYGKAVEDSRIGHKALYSLAIDPSDLKAFEQAKVLKSAGLNIASIVEFLKLPKFNTGFEELECVGLDRDASVLHGHVRIKRPSGYSGNLCQSGSREYVAFYLDFGSGWEFMGTTSVGVHDIPQIRKGGLCYLATLPVSLTEHQMKWCETGKAKIRGILSWNVPPTPNDPDYVAHWGDWEECCIEIRPLPKDTVPGKLVPIIESIGSMPVSLINASGYANGTNSVNLTANDSPFNGNILITGIIANQVNSSDPMVPQLRYRLMVKEPSSATAQPWTKTFEIFTTKISGGIPQPQTAVTQTPNMDGWVDYHPDFMIPDIISVDRNVLGIFRPSEEGLHEIYLQVDNPSSPFHISSATHRFQVDMKAPDVDVEITSGAGNCGNFIKGDIIEGTFSMADDHCLSLSLSVTPADELNGASVEIGAPGGPSSLSYPSSLSGTGTGGNQGWRLDTGLMNPCGYNIRIVGEDRTIVNSAVIGHISVDIEGFCLGAPEMP